MIINTDHYTPELHALLAPLESLQFDYSSQSDEGTRTLLVQIDDQQLFGAAASSQIHANCCRSGLWLLHGFQHESHEISQTIHLKEGSFWHAIMHRAEQDFGNSKYWYRKVSTHQVLEQLNSHPDGAGGEQLVDLCERATTDVELVEKANEAARLEWSLLFEYCFRLASDNQPTPN